MEAYNKQKKLYGKKAAGKKSSSSSAGSSEQSKAAKLPAVPLPLVNVVVKWSDVKIGDESQAITGIVSTFLATVEVIERVRLPPLHGLS